MSLHQITINIISIYFLSYPHPLCITTIIINQFQNSIEHFQKIYHICLIIHYTHFYSFVSAIKTIKYYFMMKCSFLKRGLVPPIKLTIIQHLNLFCYSLCCLYMSLHFKVLNVETLNWLMSQSLMIGLQIRFNFYCIKNQKVFWFAKNYRQMLVVIEFAIIILWVFEGQAVSQTTVFRRLLFIQNSEFLKIVSLLFLFQKILCNFILKFI